MSITLASLPTTTSVQPTEFVVLVLDPGAVFGLSLTRSLRRYGLEVVLATSPARAAQLFRTHRIGAMILHDDSRGRSLIPELRKMRPNTPCICIRADCSESSKRDLIAAAPERNLSKPLELGEVINTLQGWQYARVAPLATHTRTRASRQTPVPRPRPERTQRSTSRELSAARETARMPAVRDETSTTTKRRTAATTALREPSGVYSIVNRRATLESADTHSN